MKNLLAGILLLSASTAFAHQTVPSYFPLWSDAGKADWSAMCVGMDASGNGSTAIANVSSGPWIQVDPNFVWAIDYCHNLGNNVVGYVHTSYGARSIAEVNGEIDRWYQFYPTIDGIFFDEVGTGPDAAATGCDASCTTVRQYYQQTYNKVHTVGGPLQNDVILNPGTPPATAWMFDTPAGDEVVVFEGSADNYLAWTPPAWVLSQPGTDFVHLVYAVTSAQFTAVRDHAIDTNGHHTYFTEQTLPNPWSELSQYLPQ